MNPRKPHKRTAETIKNRLNGEKATITWVQREKGGRKIPIIKKTEVKKLGKKKKIEKTEQPIPISTTEASEVAKAAKATVKDAEKSNRMEMPKTEKPKASKKPKAELSKLQKEVLKFITDLDHPATSNEVRDEFKFPLRANARRIFRVLEKRGFGENRKEGNRYRFYVKGKEYPEPTEEK